jgi:hypothetical protein
MADDFDLSELISTPIAALNEAEAGAAARFVELLLDYAIDHTVKSDAAEGTTPLREVSFDMQRVAATGQMETRRISLPLLQLMPLGGVSIDQATLNYGFSMRAVRQAATAATKISPSAPAAAENKPRFVGSLAQSAGRAPDGSPASDANITIEIKLRQMDLPRGVLDLLQQTQGGTDTPIVSAPRPPLFTAEVAKKSGQRLVPGTAFSTTVAVTPRAELGEPLQLTFSAQPQEFARLSTPAKPVQIDAARTFNVKLAIAANARLDPQAPPAIIIRGDTKGLKGTPETLSLTIQLPLTPT